jgi:hypothetical protein
MLEKKLKAMRKIKIAARQNRSCFVIWVKLAQTISMEFLNFVVIVVGSLVFASLVYLVFKNRYLKSQLEKSVSEQEKYKLGPVEGFSQEVWNKISEKVMDSSDEYLLMFDENLRLRMWNKTAKGMFKFDQGIALSDLEEALEIESKERFKEQLKDISNSPSTLKESIELKWKEVGAIEHKLHPIVGKDRKLEAIALSGMKKQEARSAVHPQEAVDQLVRSVEKPVLELKVLSGNMGEAISAEPVSVENLNVIRKQQDSLIDAVQNVISFYKKEGARIQFSEDVKSASVNSLVRSLCLVIDSIELPLELNVQKALQVRDCNCLLQVSNFQRLVSSFLSDLLDSANNPRAQADMKISWEQSAMEISLFFNLSLSQLGQGLGAAWLNKVMNKKTMFINYQSQFAALSCTLDGLEHKGDTLAFKLVLPRDIS